jgi:hypothetical protein
MSKEQFVQRNLIFVRTGDSSLHKSWVVPRAKRNYDLFISYFGSNPGTFRDDGEYYEVASGLKYPAFTKLLNERAELVYSYDAVWIPDDDLLTSATLINRMFDLFHRYKLLLAQPALAPGSYWAHEVTRMMEKKSLHFSRFVEVMCPIFRRSALKTLASTFSLNASSWGIDSLWPHLLGYPAKRIAVLDETPVVHTRPVGKGSFYDVLKGQNVDAVADRDRILKQYKIDYAKVRTHVFGSVPAKSPVRAVGSWVSILPLQERIDSTCKHPIFYENRARKLRLKNSERPKIDANGESSTAGAGGGQPAVEIKRLMGANKRLEAIAQDFARHWTARQKMSEGKAMIVCSDPGICLKLFRRLSRLRPEWKKQGVIKVAVGTAGSPADAGENSVLTKSRQDLARQFRDPQNPLKIIIVDDIRQADFDCPLLNTLYVDLAVPIGQHLDMVRALIRIFKNKLATLVVDYLGLSGVIFQEKQSAVSDKTAVVQRWQGAPIKTKISPRPLPRPSQSPQEGGRVLTPRPQPASTTSGGERIAHLFLIRNNLNHEGIWKEFFRGHEKYYNIYVHAKEPDKMASKLLRNNRIARQCETTYGHVSLVKAELLLLKEALKSKENKFFLLHSESCVPIRSFESVYGQLFEAGRSWLHYFKDDLWRYYGVEMTAIPYDLFFKSSQFFCLTRSHAEAVLANGRLEHWKHCQCADEHFIPTVLAMGGQIHDCLPRPLTFTEWNQKRRESPAGPTTFHKLSSNDLEALLRTESLFARKFAPDSDISRHIKKLHARPAAKTFAERHKMTRDDWRSGDRVQSTALGV